MVETADIVVVGGGCIGTSIALHLAEKSAGKVLLLEKKSWQMVPRVKGLELFAPTTPIRFWLN